MMTFGEYLEARQAVMFGPIWLTQATAAGLATPGTQDTRRAIEKARRRGAGVTADALRASISPERQRMATHAVRAVLPSG